MNRALPLVAAAVVLALAGGSLWFFFAPRPEADAPSAASPPPPEPGPAAPAPRKPAPNLEEGAPARPSLPEGFDAPVEKLDDLDARFRAGSEVTLDFADLDRLNPADATRGAQDRMFAAVATVEAAARAHLEYADRAPRDEAEIAVRQAADLYDHLADVVEGARPPAQVPPGEASIQRGVWKKMADAHRRTASSLRARPGSP